MRLSTRTLALGVGLATAVVATLFEPPLGYHRFSPRDVGIAWLPCNGTGDFRQCGRFEVPLDYQNPTAGKASLAVALYPATRQPKQGTLFLNPGGPGGSGIATILGGNAERISQLLGGYYDLVSWDPRGVGYTIPRADCFASSFEESNFWRGTIPHTGIEARGNFTDQADLVAFFAQVPEVDDLLVQLGQRCLQYSPDTLQYLGTAAAVRDMVALSDYLEGPGRPINFWGFSYGTVIGIYFVNMFPDRVGRVVLDGVVDPVYWANRPPHEFWAVSVESADEAFTGFLQACASVGPAGCAFAIQNSTPESLRNDVLRILDSAYELKKSVGAARATYGSSIIRSVVLDYMYSPTTWPELARDLAVIYNFFANLTSSSPSPTKRAFNSRIARPRLQSFPRRQPVVPRQTPNQQEPATDYAFQAVTCSDAVDPGNVTTQMVFEELVRVTREVSPMFGPMWGSAGLYCHRWPARAVERYTGPWNNILSNSILVIGNEADPITPFISAKNVADMLGDSAVLVQQDDYGHTSLAMHSSCTLSILSSYFLNNTLPSADQFCGTDQTLFPGSGITNNTIPTNLSGNASATRTGIAPSSVSNGSSDDAKSRAGSLHVAIIALVCAIGLMS